jgi:hypothetical protein
LPLRRRALSAQTINVWSKNDQRTVFARQPLQAGKAVTFISVLIPHERGTAAATLAAQVSVQYPDGDRVRVNIKHAADNIEFLTSDISP